MYKSRKNVDTKNKGVLVKKYIFKLTQKGGEMVKETKVKELRYNTSSTGCNNRILL